ncbi:restriction endonuclease subunit S [Shimwellia blattae]|uniref:Type-1 restriction enzyme StySJI specificity protein n=1 Tax=Shimwellia blattae (strain ATCC 29907 / DSM 4481 / JCM 1650 / NBRC 105725 / CDC 9005-74) TaxID=630626 RepID=I2BDC7_SHIBC|nr:restriction endonuclease subunit S [Shimwellia blattae]AFJ48531.1 type-1 restriction enzyme StySJI specificity protein [Shimwellia blattae DSM 4481 = NBRC 105725]GAB81432.1 type I restriction enzyme EcoKI S protein [Shimwellia blattae DSM 4481 = NBRC 105725]VDY66022.1 Type I restriction enzyme EcoKI specificity protein [Shimwellia blattae]VEC26659.1 Type I restriction enzyme EcoKI specificity protein [Shimwellia blattae]
MSGGKLPEGWVKSELDNILLTIIGGGTPSKAIPEYYQGDIPWMSVKDMNKHTLTDTIDHITNDAVENSSTNIIPAGTPIIATRMSLGKIVTASFDSAINQDLKALFLSNGVDRNFFIHWYRSQAQLIESLGTGTTVKGIRLEVLKALSINLPPFFEQKIIAEKLDTLLAQVESTKARLEQIPQILKRFRQAVLSVAMSGGLTEEWRKSNSILFSSWVNSNIGELAQVATGKTPKRTEVKYWENGSIPWLTSSITGEIYTEVAEQFITPIALKECTLKIFSPGTLLLAMYGEGKTRGQVTELKIHAACNQACAAIICDKEKIDLQFLKMRLMENYQETRKAAAGGNQPNLNLNKVREIPVIVPPLPEQAEIVRRVEQLFAYADTIEKQVNSALTCVNNLTQSMLAKAFRGELTAQWRAENPELISGENSAAALLEKIKAERAASGGKKAARKKA